MVLDFCQAARNKETFAVPLNHKRTEHGRNKSQEKHRNQGNQEQARRQPHCMLDNSFNNALGFTAQHIFHPSNNLSFAHLAQYWPLINEIRGQIGENLFFHGA